MQQAYRRKRSAAFDDRNQGTSICWNLTCRLHGLLNESHPALASPICPVVSQAYLCSIWEPYRFIHLSLQQVIMVSYNSCLQDLLTSVFVSPQPSVQTEIGASFPKHKAGQLIPCLELFSISQPVPRGIWSSRPFLMFSPTSHHSLCPTVCLPDGKFYISPQRPGYLWQPGLDS